MRGIEGTANSQVSNDLFMSCLKIPCVCIYIYILVYIYIHTGVYIYIYCFSMFYFPGHFIVL